MTSTHEVAVVRHHQPTNAAEALAADVRAGLTSRPKTLPPKWFYDAAGSDLFEQITRLPEYYPTRREREVLARHAGEVAAATRAESLVELGSGSSEKTRLLLDALLVEGTLRRYVPVDVSESALVTAAESVAAAYPGLDVLAVVADFDAHLEALPADDRRLVAFLGGTIGNFDPAARKGFLSRIAGMLRPGDAFLLGTDLVKDPQRLVAAYDDSAGVTAAFNRNVLAVINRELGADFDVDAFAHEARWDDEEAWIEMHLRATRPQRVRIAGLHLDVEFAAGETVRTEISAKFTRPRLEQEFAAAGLRMIGWWSDSAGDFAVSLSVAG